MDKKETREEIKNKKKHIPHRAAMRAAMLTRLFGVTITIFILILTVKSELLDYKIITWQLVLAIPLLAASLICNSKIISQNSFSEHKIFSSIVNSVSIALIFNAIGLLVTKYVSAIIGTAYFVLFIICFGYFFAKDYKRREHYNELIIILILILLGFIPSWLILT